MTRDDIIRMAREAGFSEWAVRTPQDLERFATLVAAAEREACAKEKSGLRAKYLIVTSRRCKSFGKVQMRA
jgi:hypothetical protein